MPAPSADRPVIPGPLGDETRQVLWGLAVDAAGIGTFDWDLVSGRLAWDERLIDMFGYDVDSFDESIEAFNARLHPADLLRVTADLQHAVDAVDVFDSEYRVVLPTGEVRWIGARGRALGGEDGRAIRLLGAAFDITERRAVGLSVTSLLQSMATAFFALDPDWRFTYVNDEATVVLGRPREELVGGVIWELFPAAVGSVFEDRYRHAMSTGEAVMFDAYYPAPLDAWYEVRASLNPEGLAVYFLDITARRRLQREAERAGDRAALLSRVTTELVATLDHTTAANRLADLVVPALADWCVVSLIDDDQHTGDRRALRNIGARHSTADLQPLVDEYAQVRLTEMTDHSLVDSALHDRAEPLQHVPRDATRVVGAMFGDGRARSLFELLAPEAVVVVPLDGPNGPVGILSLGNGADRGGFTGDDLVTARHVAARAGLVLDNARLYRQQRDLAETLQRSLLSPPAEPDHVQVVVRYLPAAEAAAVGGDWYDAFLQPDGAMVIAVGDVAGHDIEAAANMAQLRSLLRGIAVHSGAGPAELMRGVDRAMTTLQIDTTATAVVARLEQNDDQAVRGVTNVRWSNAGHPPPLVIDPAGNVTALLALRPELMLGVQADTARTEGTAMLDRDSTLVFYTDGLVERRDEDLDVGLERLRVTLGDLAGEGLELDELCDRLLARMLPARPDDDIALVGVRLHRQDRPRPAEAGPRKVPPNVPPDAAPATSA